MPHTDQTGKPSARRKARRLNRLFVLGLVFVSVWGAFQFFGQLGTLRDRHAKLTGLQSKLQDVKKTNDAAKRELERLSDSEYREETARKSGNFAKRDETVFEVPQPTP